MKNTFLYSQVNIQPKQNKVSNSVSMSGYFNANLFDIELKKVNSIREETKFKNLVLHLSIRPLSSNQSQDKNPQENQIEEEFINLIKRIQVEISAVYPSNSDHPDTPFFSSSDFDHIKHIISIYTKYFMFNIKRFTIRFFGKSYF